MRACSSAVLRWGRIFLRLGRGEWFFLLRKRGWGGFDFCVGLLGVSLASALCLHGGVGVRGC
ncbi:hypothetical protein PCAR4_170012 [Paraburkholderia caribensis]|nr:hypothetical protein PCAR4_170012 [Paraburkholderia caribensis]